MKILVLGAGGMVGSMMAQYLTDQKHNVVSSFRRDFDPFRDELPKLDSYDYVINCIGLIKQKSSDTNLLFALNGKFPHSLAREHDKILHISSDCVFNGNLSPQQSYATNSIKDAIDDYGHSKAAGEPTNTMVLRTSVIGPSKDNFGLFEWFRHTEQNPVKGFANHWWSGITTLELAKIVNKIILENLYKHGIYQISNDKISKYELLLMINSIFDLHKNIQRCDDSKSVNRSLHHDILSLEIKDQLIDLKKWLDNETS